jgi:hypothetical protein
MSAKITEADNNCCRLKDEDSCAGSKTGIFSTKIYADL